MPRSAPPQQPVLPAPLGVGLAVIVGLIVPVQSRINGELSAELADPLAAAVISFGGGLALMLIAVFLSAPGRRGLRRLQGQLRSGSLPRWCLVAGAGGAMLVLAQTSTVNLIGVAIFTIAIVAGQTISGLLVDRIGFGPSGRHRLTGPRVTGAVLVLVAVTISVAARPDADLDAFRVVLAVGGPLLAGLLLGFQQAMNGRIALAAGTPLVATGINFAVGATVLVPMWGVKLATLGPGAPLPGTWWLYLGGLLGVFFIGSAAVLVRHIGVLLLGLGTVAGQLIGSLMLDVLIPTPGSTVQLTTVVGTLLTLVAVGVATLPWRAARIPVRT